MYCMDCHQNKLTLFTCEIVVFNDNNEIKRTFARILFRKYIERSGLTNVGVLDQDFRRPKQGVLAVLLMNFLLDKKGREKRCTYPEGISNIFSKTLKIEVFPSLRYNTPPPFVRKPLRNWRLFVNWFGDEGKNSTTTGSVLQPKPY